MRSSRVREMPPPSLYVTWTAGGWLGVCVDQRRNAWHGIAMLRETLAAPDVPVFSSFGARDMRRDIRRVTRECIPTDDLRFGARLMIPIGSTASTVCKLMKCLCVQRNASTSRSMTTQHE
eukprot:4874525-Prymnesium_polylepis.1